jgi:hypothetical protein
MEIFNNMNIVDEYKKNGFHIGTFDDIFTKDEIEIIKLGFENIKFTFSNGDNIICKTQHNGDHRYPFYDGIETYNHPYNDIILVDEYMKKNNYTLFQRWKQLDNCTNYELKNELGEIFTKNKYDILNKFYPEFTFLNDDINIGGAGTIGMYEKGDKQPPHFDAGSERTIFGILYYLTDETDWDEESGGEFLINSNGLKISPTFGKYVLLDFVDNLLEHEVLELKKDYRRYMVISFPSVIDNGSERVNKFLEKKRKSNTFMR